MLHNKYIPAFDQCPRIINLPPLPLPRDLQRVVNVVHRITFSKSAAAADNQAPYYQRSTQACPASQAYHEYVVVWAMGVRHLTPFPRPCDGGGGLSTEDL